MTAATAFRRAAALVARTHRVPLAGVLEPRGREARRHRQLAAYLAVVGLGHPIRQVAVAAGVKNHNAIRHALARIEDLRDSPAVDARLERLETRLCRAA